MKIWLFLCIALTWATRKNNKHSVLTSSLSPQFHPFVEHSSYPSGDITSSSSSSSFFEHAFKTHRSSHKKTSESGSSHSDSRSTKIAPLSEERKKQDDENRKLHKTESITSTIEHKPSELQPPVYRLENYDYTQDSLRPGQFDFVGFEPPKGPPSFSSSSFSSDSRSSSFEKVSAEQIPTFQKPNYLQPKGSGLPPVVKKPFNNRNNNFLQMNQQKFRVATGAQRYGPIDSWWEGGGNYLVLDAAYGGEGVASFPHTKWGLPDERSFASTVITFDVDFESGWDAYIGPHGGLTIGTEAGRMAQWTYHEANTQWSPGVDCVVDWFGAWISSHRVYWTQWGEAFDNLTPDRTWWGNGANYWKIAISNTGAATFTAGPVHFSFTMKLRDNARLGFWVYPYSKLRIGNIQVQRLPRDQDLMVGDTISIADSYWRTSVAVQSDSDLVPASGVMDTWSGDPLGTKQNSQFTIFDAPLWGLPFVQFKTYDKNILSCDWSSICKRTTTQFDSGVANPDVNLLSTRFLLVRSYDGTWSIKWGGSNCYEWYGGWCYRAAHYVQTFMGYELRLVYYEQYYDWMNWERYWVYRWPDVGGCPPGQSLGLHSEPLRCDDCSPGCVCLASEQYPCPSGTIQPNFGGARCQPCGDFQITYNPSYVSSSGSSSSGSSGSSGNDGASSDNSSSGNGNSSSGGSSNSSSGGTSSLPGGQGWLQLGPWRMGEYDPKTFVVSNDNGVVHLVFSSDGNAAWWPQTTPSLQGRSLDASSSGVVFGDRFIEFNQRWRLGVPDMQSLTLSHSSGLVAVKWGSGGMRTPGPTYAGSTWDRPLLCSEVKYGPGFLELAGAWRISYSAISFVIHSGSNPNAETFVELGQTLVSTPTNCASITGLETPLQVPLDQCDAHCRQSVGCTGFDYCNMDQGCAPGVGMAKSPKGTCWPKTSTCTAKIASKGNCGNSTWCLYRYVSEPGLACLDITKPYIFNASTGGLCCSSQPVNNVCSGSVCALSSRNGNKVPLCVSSMNGNYQTQGTGINGCQTTAASGNTNATTNVASIPSAAQCGATKCTCRPGYKRKQGDPTACVACAAGNFCFMEKEAPCPVDTFNPYSAGSSCQKCPPNQWTAGQTGKTSCKCMQNKYIGLNGKGCVTCPQNYDCFDYLSPLCPYRRWKENVTGAAKDVPRDCLPPGGDNPVPLNSTNSSN